MRVGKEGGWLAAVSARIVALCACALVGHTSQGRAQQRPSGSTQPPAMAVARLVGRVIDSTRNAPLSDAVVQLVSAADPLKSTSVVTGSDGSFSFDLVGADTYLLGFVHPRQAELGVAPQLYRVDIQSKGTVTAALFIPSVPSIIASRCGVKARDDSTGMLFGTVRSAVDGEPLPHAIVRAQWADVFAELLQPPRVLVRREANENGEFAICGLALRGSVSVRAWSGADTSGVIDVELSASRLRNRDIFVGPSGVVVGSPSVDSKGVGGRRIPISKGVGTARGIVRRVNGAPLVGATVSVIGTDVEVITGATGEYVFRALPLGTYMLEARAIGQIPVRASADIRADAPPETDFALESAGQYLDTVKVRSRVVPSGLADFERRRERSAGYYVDATALERRQPAVVSDVLRGIPGLLIRPGRNGAVVAGTASSGGCTPTVFVDGTIFSVSGSIDNVLSASDIKAVEVYTRSASIPSEFLTRSGQGSQCAVIVLWTGRR